MSDLIQSERIKHGFPAIKTGNEHFTAYWDGAHYANNSQKFNKVKFTVSPNLAAQTEIGESDVFIKVAIRCSCGCERHGQIAHHTSKPTKIIAPDDRMMGLSFGYSVDTLARYLSQSGCTCLKESDADAVFQFFDSGEYKNVVLFGSFDVGSNVTLENANINDLMDIYKTLQ